MELRRIKNLVANSPLSTSMNVDIYPNIHSYKLRPFHHRFLPQQIKEDILQIRARSP